MCGSISIIAHLRMYIISSSFSLFCTALSARTQSHTDYTLHQMFQVASHPTSFAMHGHGHHQPSLAPHPSIQLPRTLARPPFAEVSRDAIVAAAPECTNIPPEYIRRGLRSKAPQYVNHLSIFRVNKNTNLVFSRHLECSQGSPPSRLPIFRARCLNHISRHPSPFHSAPQHRRPPTQHTSSQSHPQNLHPTTPSQSSQSTPSSSLLTAPSSPPSPPRSNTHTHTPSTFPSSHFPSPPLPHSPFSTHSCTLTAWTRCFNPFSLYPQGSSKPSPTKPSKAPSPPAPCSTSSPPISAPPLRQTCRR